MKVNGAVPSYIQTLTPRTSSPVELPTVIATGIGLDIRSKGTSENIVKENNPDDPIVAKKVLDALSLDLIRFSQKEREALSSILGEKAKAVRESRA